MHWMFSNNSTFDPRGRGLTGGVVLQGAWSYRGACVGHVLCSVKDVKGTKCLCYNVSKEIFFLQKGFFIFNI